MCTFGSEGKLRALNSHWTRYVLYKHAVVVARAEKEVVGTEEGRIFLQLHFGSCGGYYYSNLVYKWRMDSFFSITLGEDDPNLGNITELKKTVLQNWFIYAGQSHADMLWELRWNKIIALSSRSPGGWWQFILFTFMTGCLLSMDLHDAEIVLDFALLWSDVAEYLALAHL